MTRQGQWQFALRALAVAGALVCAGQVILWSMIGAWPFHDTVTFWLAGAHLREGAPVYGRILGTFLSMVYAPPIVVIYAGLSLLPAELVVALQFIAQILALRYVCGSWRSAGLVSWLPFVPRELVTGNVDFLMGAAIYAAIRGVRGSGAAIAVFTLAKFSPAIALAFSPRQWRLFVVSIAILVAITLPWAFLWPQWAANLLASTGASIDFLPLLPRVPFVLGLLVLRRPWSVAAAAALATPAFYFHSVVLFLPACRLAIDSPSGRVAIDRALARIRTRLPATSSQPTPS